jgi:hypothetical protein
MVGVLLGLTVLGYDSFAVKCGTPSAVERTGSGGVVDE